MIKNSYTAPATALAVALPKLALRED